MFVKIARSLIVFAICLISLPPSVLAAESDDSVVKQENSFDALFNEAVKRGEQKDETIRRSRRQSLMNLRESGKNGGTVRPENLDSFVANELIAKVGKKEVTITSRDGIKRAIVRVRIKLLPNHLRVRAKKFLPEVLRYSDEIGVVPELVLAVIHTESYFNPLAQSPAYAFGLMQLIPQYGARDAYRFLFS